MKTFRIPVLIINKGYCEEEAETLEEAIQIIEDGNYLDIYGEELVSVQVDEDEKVEVIADDDDDDDPSEEEGAEEE